MTRKRATTRRSGVPPAATPKPPSRGVTLALVAALALVLLRSWIHVFYRDAHFDSDQAIMGIMAHDLATGRELAFYCYGQKYLFALEAWLAAPLFWIAGPSVAALKLPILAFHLVTVGLLLRQLLKIGLSATSAFTCVLPLAVPSVFITRTLLAAHGGSIEPLFATVILWSLRGRPIGFGVVAGILYLNREFVAYPIVALVLVELLHRQLLDWRHLVRRLAGIGVAIGIVILGRFIGQYSANYFASEGFPLSLERDLPRSLRFSSYVLQTTLGIDPGPVDPRQPYHALLAILLATVAIVIVARAGMILAARHDRAQVRWSATSFPLYLLCTGLISTAALLLLSGMPKNLWSVRYNLLSILGLVGFFAFYFTIEPRLILRAVVGAGIAAFFAVHLAAHVKLLATSSGEVASANNRAISDHLVSHGYQAARAPYWTAYAVSFLSGESVQVASSEQVRIERYEKSFRDASLKRAEIQKRPCPGGEAVGGMYICPVGSR